MKVLLRNSDNGLYFSGPSEWAEQPAQAVDFLGTAQALQAAQQFCLKNVQVVLSFGVPQEDIVLPLVA